MKIDYNDIVRSVSVNLGVDSPNNKQVSIIKRDIYMTLLKVMRKSTPVKREHEEDINTHMQELYLPEDFFTAYEVIFNSESGNRYLSREVEMEKYHRWNPNPETLNSNFEDYALASNPTEYFWTTENVDLDGRIGYYFTDEEDISKLIWKPAINGSVKVLYSAITEQQFEDVDSTPDLHYSFRELLIIGSTIQGLLRKPSKTEIEMNEKVLSIRMYKDEFNEMLKEFAGYINRRTNSPIVSPFDFMNDINQTLWS